MSGVDKGRVKLLVNALRDPEQRQASGKLGSERGYCCLGVACEVAIANGLDLYREELPEAAAGDFMVRYGDDLNAMTLPWAVAEWYGFAEVDPYLRLDGKMEGKMEGKATFANDSLGMTLKSIGDAFEATYLSDEAAAA